MSRLALARALGAYLLWGLFPLYFQHIREVAPLEVLAHRIVWALAVLLLILLAYRQLGAFRKLLSDRKNMLWLSLGALMMATNWFVYIYAISHERALEASLGYFINPLINIILAVLLLGERFTRNQMIALALAGVGISVQLVETAGLPWISLVLALSWGSYSLIKNKMQTPALIALSAETLVLAPAALCYLLWLQSQNELVFGQSFYYNSLLPLAGLVTALPLLLFGAAAKHLSLVTLSFIQYMTPSMIFIIALTVFDEPLTDSKAITFTCIWAGLIFFSLDQLPKRRPKKSVQQTEHTH